MEKEILEELKKQTKILQSIEHRLEKSNSVDIEKIINEIDKVNRHSSFRRS